MAAKSWCFSVFLWILLGFAYGKITPVKVSVYYESLCPDSRRYFFFQIKPTYNALAQYIDLEFVPYGNAHYSGKPDHYSFTCQHGPPECFGNMAQACFSAITNDTKSTLDFILCAFSTPSQPSTIEQCITSKVIKEKTRNCVNGPMGKNLLYQMGKKTDSLYPQHTFIPWTTINGKGSDTLNNKAMEDLMSLVCSEFVNEKPDACKNAKTNIIRRLLFGSYYL